LVGAALTAVGIIAALLAPGRQRPEKQVAGPQPGLAFATETD